MTEQEAIKEVKSWTNILMSAGSKCVSETAEAQDMAIKALEEIQQYRAIGTPEECRAAVEKQRAKKVKDVTMVRDNEGYIGRIGKCPCCEDIVEEDTLYCDCGQKLDWGDEE